MFVRIKKLWKQASKHYFLHWSLTKEAEQVNLSEQSIRLKAYDLWEADGKPHGKNEYYWYRAIEELKSVRRRARRSVFSKLLIYTKRFFLWIAAKIQRLWENTLSAINSAKASKIRLRGRARQDY